ncbi:MAG: hypothetical protein HY544_04315 [Candidatus Diapherotrites archaeon]|uniref:DOD-type homing endonuclease domain-containing protein n=1 Tax=Candidatus Iainarchaeum sp. TaxID=3101447 RepID=A0A8T3YLX2_9ARCH|nr:hypothetical protein [Candidatus Diapherotrites archaeon]
MNRPDSAPAMRCGEEYKEILRTHYMSRLTFEEKGLVEKLILQGVSLNKISKITGRNKSTLYWYYAKLKGGKKFEEPQFETNYSELEGEIVGIFAGDGSQHHAKDRGSYAVNVHFGKLEYVKYVKGLFESYFNKKFRLKKESMGRFRLTTYSKKIFWHFMSYLDYVPQIKHCTVKLKRADFPREFKIGFLRGLVDTDGTICRCKDKRIRIAFYTTSESLANQTKSLLAEFGFHSFTSVNHRANLKDCHSTYLLSRSVGSFIELIRPYKARKFQGPLV